MIDWKRKCLELAEVVNRHRKDRMHTDMKLGWEMAKELIELGKRECEAKRDVVGDEEWWLR